MDYFDLEEKQKTNITIERARAKVTQKQLAKEIGVSENYVYILEQKKRCPSVHLALKIARFFGLEITDFEEFNN